LDSCKSIFFKGREDFTLNIYFRIFIMFQQINLLEQDMQI